MPSTNNQFLGKLGQVLSRLFSSPRSCVIVVSPDARGRLLATELGAVGKEVSLIKTETGATAQTKAPLRRELQESGVVVYTVRVGSLPLPKSVGGMVMEQIAAVSGGKSFWPGNSARMDQAFEQIAWDLRRQYLIGHLPSSFVADGKLHRIKVCLTVPRGLSREVVVGNRKGDYAVTKLAAR